jgi:hypothetical protein
MKNTPRSNIKTDAWRRSYDTLTSLDGSAKAKLKDNYLEIFKDVVSADAAAAGELDESEEDPDEEAPGILKY